jgi:hypothetical protein
MENHKDIVINLTPKEEAAYKRYAQLWGEAWYNKAVEAMQAQEWLQQRFNKAIEITYKRHCYQEGTDIYTIKEGTVSDADMIALKVLDRGQYNKYELDVNGAIMRHYWQCDSGD